MVNNLLDMARLRGRRGAAAAGSGSRSRKSSAARCARMRRRRSTAPAVRTSLPPDLPLLHLDAVLIERVLCNLLENAAKYTPAGSADRDQRQRGRRPDVAS